MKIIELWRYPVKSMRGEILDRAAVSPSGIEGDRQWAVVDAHSGVSLSAKRYGDLLRCRARTVNGEVRVLLPNGRELPAGSGDLAHELSDLFKRQVILSQANTVETIRHEFPEAVREGTGDPFLWEPGTSAFFDTAPLHLLTTGTLSKLGQLLPNSVIHATRFRPNILVETADNAFVEDNWVDKNIDLGPVRCHVDDHMRRCVMVTRPQGELPKDTKIIRTIVSDNDANVGIALKALDTGTLNCGDTVKVLSQEEPLSLPR